jgi:hypothetical protein
VLLRRADDLVIDASSRNRSRQLREGWRYDRGADGSWSVIVSSAGERLAGARAARSEGLRMPQ